MNQAGTRLNNSWYRSRKGLSISLRWGFPHTSKNASFRRTAALPIKNPIITWLQKYVSLFCYSIKLKVAIVLLWIYVKFYKCPSWFMHINAWIFNTVQVHIQTRHGNKVICWNVCFRFGLLPKTIIFGCWLLLTPIALVTLSTAFIR